MMASTKWRAARGFGLTQSEQVVEEYFIPSPSVLSRRERKDCLSVPSTAEPRVDFLCKAPSLLWKITSGGHCVPAFQRCRQVEGGGGSPPPHLGVPSKTRQGKAGVGASLTRTSSKPPSENKAFHSSRVGMLPPQVSQRCKSIAARRLRARSPASGIIISTTSRRPVPPIASPQLCRRRTRRSRLQLKSTRHNEYTSPPCGTCAKASPPTISHRSLTPRLASVAGAPATTLGRSTRMPRQPSKRVSISAKRLPWPPPTSTTVSVPRSSRASTMGGSQLGQ